MKRAALRGAGLSRPKISYLYDLADHVRDGRLDLHALDLLRTYAAGLLQRMGAGRAMIEWFGPVLTEYYAGSEGGFLEDASARK